MMRPAIAALVSLVVGTSLAFGCSGEVAIEAPPDGAAPPEDAAVRDTSILQDRDEPDPDPPAGLPEGWVLERGYDKRCGAYVPKSREYLPSPVRWEPCPANAQPAGASCKFMTIDWESSNSQFPGGAESGTVRATGAATLSVYRNVKPKWAYSLVADADGPVHTAVLQTSPACGFSGRVHDTRYALDVHEYDSKGGGVIAGDIGSLQPSVFVHLDPQYVHSPYPGPLAIINLTHGTIERYSWTGGVPLGVLWSSAQESGLQEGIPVFAGDAMFFPASNSSYHKIKIHTPSLGVKDFLSAGLVTDRGYGDLGTDGKDLVWIEASGRTGSSGPFPTLTVMTAPFTTDAASIAPRRLRTEEGPSFDVRYFHVGCGYAARSNGYHIRIIRLKDGRSWTLPSDNATFAWSEPYAITCTELFARVATTSAFHLARVRLDSLGPGIAPD